MTKPYAPVFAPYQERPGSILGSHVSRWLLAGSALALAACSSTPLPPWPATSGMPSATRPAASATPPSTSPSEATASITPIAPSTRLEALPYSAAIADLFPEPAERYSTPGLSEGRQSATTNAELADMLATLSQTSSNSIRLAVLTPGAAQSGTPLMALVATKASMVTPLALDESRRPNVMLVAGQQGTDIAPTEAILVIAKELASGGKLAGLLDRINVILVPRANPDGFDKGIATTADGTDLRYDHLALKTPEARFLAKLARDYRPAVLLDAGEFDAIEPTLQRFGAVRSNDLAVQFGLSPNSHEFITKAAREWLHQPTTAAMAQSGLRVDWSAEPAGTSAEAGFAMGTLEPTTLRNVSSLKNVVSLAIDSRGSDLGRLHLQRRVHSQVQSIQAILNSAAARADELRQVHGFVTRDVASNACRNSVVIQATPRVEQRGLSLIDAQTAQMVQKPVSWSSALGISNPRTRSHACGYWLSPNAVQATERLNMLGVIVQRVAELAPIQGESYQASQPAGVTSDAPRTSAISLQPATMEAAPGSYYVSMNQPLAYLAVAALEPDTPYSYYATGVLRDLSEVARVTTLPNMVFEEE